ncbi:hypothetical protein RIF29_32209 [Crotalaria pallida]|uniref:Uncharacterized protein n=1 Tax=Crotalaria pallida TaxID=3830 RepID=A0AAN9EKD4_CROPI
MLSAGGETPSRYELLSMVKKHSNLIGKTVVEEQDASDVEMDMRFWRDVFDLYFVLSKESRRRQDDDLVFFVRKLVADAVKVRIEVMSVVYDDDDVASGEGKV